MLKLFVFLIFIQEKRVWLEKKEGEEWVIWPLFRKYDCPDIFKGKVLEEK